MGFIIGIFVIGNDAKNGIFEKMNIFSDATSTGDATTLQSRLQNLDHQQFNGGGSGSSFGYNPSSIPGSQRYYGAQTQQNNNYQNGESFSDKEL